MYLTACFNSVRAVSGQREPILLNVTLRNDEESAALVSIFVKIPSSLGFDRAGLLRETRRRIGLIRAGGEKTIPVPIFVRSTTREGEYPIEVRATIHNEQYDKTQRELTYPTSLRVIKV